MINSNKHAIVRQAKGIPNPLYPEGYAEPDKMLRFPQQKAELMGGRIPISETVSIVPRNLLDTVIGEKTGCEIYWMD